MMKWRTPAAATVSKKPGSTVAATELLQWFNQQVGKTQRLSDLHFIDELPRSAIGKVLKRELLEQWSAAQTGSA